MMAILVIGIGLGAAIALWHRERMAEVEEQVRGEMQRKIDMLNKMHARDEIRLYDEIMDLQEELAKFQTGEQKALNAAYQRGRKDTRQEMTESDRWIAAYEKQRVHCMLRGN